MGEATAEITKTKPIVKPREVLSREKKGEIFILRDQLGEPINLQIALGKQVITKRTAKESTISSRTDEDVRAVRLTEKLPLGSAIKLKTHTETPAKHFVVSRPPPKSPRRFGKSLVDQYPNSVWVQKISKKGYNRSFSGAKFDENNLPLAPKPA